MTGPTLWGIHAGRTGDAHTLFMNNGVIALGWHQMPDLSTLPPTRDAFKVVVAERFPDAKRGAIPNWAGQLFRFVHEMSVADLVVYPSKSDRLVHIGRVTGGYIHQPSPQDDYAHRRPVIWMSQHQRTTFSQGALYEIGSALSLFQVKNYVDEFVEVLEGKQVSSPPPTDDETVALVAEEIETTTRDFVLKKLAQELKGHPFEKHVAGLFEALGNQTLG